MSPAPTLYGYLCRVCGAEEIEQPWNATDRFRCKNCGALNHTPLLPAAPSYTVDPRFL